MQGLTCKENAENYLKILTRNGEKPDARTVRLVAAWYGWCESNLNPDRFCRRHKGCSGASSESAAECGVTDDFVMKEAFGATGNEEA